VGSAQKWLVIETETRDTPGALSQERKSRPAPKLDVASSVLGLEPETLGRVLVVDPDPAKLVARLLETHGFSVVSTDDGAVASQLLASGWFDALITDLGTRTLPGLELLRLAREIDPHLPVLLMTAAPDVQSAARAVDEGAFQYLLKPVAADRLVDATTRALEARNSERTKADILESLLEDQETMERERTEEARRFDAALGKLWLAYQPIVRPTGAVYAYEALVRSDEPSLRGAGEILSIAERVGELRELGRAVRRLAGDFALRAAGAHHVFVNLHADDLLDDLLTAGGEPLSQVAPAVVLEITERAALHDIEEAKAKMGDLRSMGFRIALDDLGAGYAGLTTFAQLRPDVVKLDMTLVRGIDADKVRRKLVALVTEVSRDIGSVVVGEGVETDAEREVLVELGCHLLQGYLFGKPARLS
jgi:EAL domain-containing protein (putative c-di-GMP-specific phosphodiesterase class I)